MSPGWPRNAEKLIKACLLRLNEDTIPGAGSPALVKFVEGGKKECCLTVHDDLLLSVDYLNPKLAALKQSVKRSAHLLSCVQ